MILENEPRKIAINPDKFDKLITALRTAMVIVMGGKIESNLVRIPPNPLFTRVHIEESM
jgi:hypothetical protein